METEFTGCKKRRLLYRANGKCEVTNILRHACHNFFMTLNVTRHNPLFQETSLVLSVKYSKFHHVFLIEVVVARWRFTNV